MSRRWTARPFVSLFVFVLLAGTLTLLVSSSAHGAAPRTLFASPTGAGTACTQAAPCGLSTALDQAANADTILVAGGFYYGTGAAVITVTKSITLCGGWNGAPAGNVVRDPKLYPSLIDGEKMRRGVYASNQASFTLDGFVVQN